LLAAVLGSGRASRLYRAVRERRLASSITAYDYTPGEIGVFVVHAPGRPAGAPPFAANAAEMRAALEGERLEPLTPLTHPVPPTPVHGSRAWVFEREEAEVRVFRMSGGVPVLVHRRPGALVHLGWFVRGGAVHEAANATGLTSLMTRVSLKGTERRSAQRIAEDAEF